MKRVIVLLCALLILQGTWALADETVALDAGDVVFTPVDCDGEESGEEPESGVLVLAFTCKNDRKDPVLITLLEPEINGQPAGFNRGWSTDEIEPDAGFDVYKIKLVADDPNEQIQTASFRFAMDGRISTPLVWENGVITSAASFEKGEAEPAAIDPVILMDENCADCAVTLTDMLSAEELAALDYGDCRIMVRGEDGLLTDVCTVEAVVDENGNATAIWSGLQMRLQDDPEFIVGMHEAADGTFDSGNITLSGISIFYATLTFSVENAQACDVTVTSAEMGGSYSVIPCSLFDTADAARSIWSLNEENGWITIMNEGAVGKTIELTGPMRFELVPVEEGDLVYFFEYFFSDGTDTIHPLGEIG